MRSTLVVGTDNGQVRGAPRDAVHGPYPDAVNPLLTLPRESLTFHVLPASYDGDAAITLRYRIEGEGVPALDLAEQVELPGDKVADTSTPEFAQALRLLSLAAGLSYYKTCAPGRVVVQEGLTPGEREFLTTVATNGLAELAFRNDRPEVLHFEVHAAERDEDGPGDPSPHADPATALVAVGGGKDSVVTIESLRHVTDVTLFSVNEYAPIRATADRAGLPLLVARRRLDPALFELNAQGALNGHVPVTAINSLVGCLTALRAGIDAVVFSNEGSSSAGNTVWHGVDVNHQWSKGLGFESLLRGQVTTPDYFSFLRPLTELAIMRRFADLREYHPVFTSCNRAFHLDESRRRLWCGECPKCRFVFLCLAPFVPREALLAVFGGRDLLADEDQREGFLELLNADGRMKPFECVGEPDECRAALTLLARHPDWTDHPFVAGTSHLCVDEGTINRLFTFDDRHFLPPAIERAARAVL
jgi:hypothetical protein